MACANSLRQLDGLGISYETIFIDSASSDNSEELAKDLFDTVIALEQSPFLNAGATRHVGTLHSRGHWVLYLDGDMELVSDIFPAIASLTKSQRHDTGLCGFTENIYPDGSKDLIQFRGNRDGENCRAFGGAVLLPRLKVIEAGNWSCSLYSYEEMELYSRLLRKQVNVIWHDGRLVEHKTIRVAMLRKILGATLPYKSYLGKKFFGAGQVTRLTLHDGHFWDFYALKPEPYIFLASVLAGLAAFPWLSLTAAFIPILAFAYNVTRSGFKGAVNYLFWLCQIPFGLFVFNPAFRPTIHRIAVAEASRNQK